jgi:hypothetical protein
MVRLKLAVYNPPPNFLPDAYLLFLPLGRKDATGLAMEVEASSDPFSVLVTLTDSAVNSLSADVH